MGLVPPGRCAWSILIPGSVSIPCPPAQAIEGFRPLLTFGPYSMMLFLG